jgi:hypothetical protein
VLDSTSLPSILQPSPWSRLLQPWQGNQYSSVHNAGTAFITLKSTKFWTSQ